MASANQSSVPPEEPRHPKELWDDKLQDARDAMARGNLQTAALHLAERFLAGLPTDYRVDCVTPCDNHHICNITPMGPEPGFPEHLRIFDRYESTSHTITFQFGEDCSRHQIFSFIIAPNDDLQVG